MFIALVLGLPGIAAIVAAFGLQAAWSWTGATIDALVNVGTALLLAAFVFGVQRHATRRVINQTRAATAAVQAEVRAAEERFETRTAAVEQRLSDLGETTRERVAERDRAQDAAIAALSETVSYETVTRTLQEANDLDAFVWDSRVTVQASSAFDVLDLKFAWLRSVMNNDRLTPPYLVIQLVPRHPTSRRVPPEIRWKPNQSPDEVGDEITQELRRSGVMPDAGFDWAMALRNLHRAIKLAVQSRRRDAGARWFRGAIIEFVGQQFVLTEAGIEAVDRDYLFEHDRFPESHGFDQSGLPLVKIQWPPDRPEWADPTEWSVAVRRGEQSFPWSPGPFRMAPQVVPARSDQPGIPH